ncbi:MULTISPECIES: YqeG family HAD IIIA-type phosphatase [unclassified Granulicatella]|uniref:YqeG family HAD IIIA-type phosphatase n=1 Tax=unclassified Granulicatella TaxID=2630493 RepID=UPI0010739F7D|nr:MULTISPECIES: YqeG family HAD IIIA-type phosphatase [unclassified Granulicatella]MBF0779939.1 YqeG family HAD IIIA-type phosphatase [Granulicatella sp. 19428wC4_WM01]TFU95956.1 YqeG family HAD IIIA-type phosphatase [Granulicatella sp. WM01]
MKLLKPMWLVKDIVTLTPEDFQKLGVRTIFIDVDNTLIALDNPFHNQDMQTWVKALQAKHIEVVALSNNTTKHVQTLVEPFGIPFVANAKKPTLLGLKKAMACVQAKKEYSILIGDQLFTDILAGNRMGIRTILVKSLGKKDLFATKIIRNIEKRVLGYICRKYHLNWR